MAATDERETRDLSTLAYSGPLGTDGPGEFRCDECNARCTEDPRNGTEYGHRVGCPNRPNSLRRSASSGGNYHRPGKTWGSGRGPEPVGGGR